MGHMMMHSGAKRALDVRALILEALHERPYRPAELLEKLHTQDLCVTRLKDELALLVDQHVVELSPDRFIKVRGAKPATSE